MVATHTSPRSVQQIEEEIRALRARVTAAQGQKAALESRLASGPPRTGLYRFTIFLMVLLGLGAGLFVRALPGAWAQMLGVIPCLGYPMSPDATITLSRSACYEGCPEYRVAIHADGTVVYDGLGGTAPVGHKTATVSVQDVRALFDAANRSCFFRMREEYVVPVTDLSGVTVSIETGGISKVVRHYPGDYPEIEGSCAPRGLVRLEHQIDVVALTSKGLGLSRP